MRIGGGETRRRGDDAAAAAAVDFGRAGVSLCFFLGRCCLRAWVLPSDEMLTRGPPSWLCGRLMRGPCWLGGTLSVAVPVPAESNPAPSRSDDRGVSVTTDLSLIHI